MYITKPVKPAKQFSKSIIKLSKNSLFKKEKKQLNSLKLYFKKMAVILRNFDFDFKILEI